MRYCKRCVYPEVAAHVSFDDEGVCSGCRVAEEFNALTPEFWDQRAQRFAKLMEQYRSKDQSNYDCIIAVSGGKDSYWQTHIVKNVYGLNPLLVTYHGNNYMEEGQGNLDRMREMFGVDHIVFGPSVEALKKLNRICFKRMGDMNWHAHCGIKTFPVIAAVKFKVPIVVWGETVWLTAGMFSPDDYVEYNKRTVFEHDMRGFGWRDMVDEDEGLKEGDLLWARMPSDEDIAAVGVRGIYVGNYFKYDPNANTEIMRDKYRFEVSRKPFDRTYRRMSNLDDMHENGIHDYLKYIKFGYGRGSDHASMDIRYHKMTRKEGIEMVRKYDHVKSRVDLERWLSHVGMSEKEFDDIADKFRDPRVWRKEKGAWTKDNIWDEKT